MLYIATNKYSSLAWSIHNTTTVVVAVTVAVTVSFPFTVTVTMITSGPALLSWVETKLDAEVGKRPKTVGVAVIGITWSGLSLDVTLVALV